MIEEKNILTKILKHESFKKYRKQIINLLTVSKQTNYNKCFEEKKNSSAVIWFGINENYMPKKYEEIKLLNFPY